jgi:hypothetical protein
MVSPDQLAKKDQLEFVEDQDVKDLLDLQDLKVNQEKV